MANTQNVCQNNYLSVCKHPRNLSAKIFLRKRYLKHYEKYYFPGLEKKLKNKYANN